MYRIFTVVIIMFSAASCFAKTGSLILFDRAHGQTQVHKQAQKNFKKMVDELDDSVKIMAYK